MPDSLRLFPVLSCLFISGLCFAQQPVQGNVIPDFGPTYVIENPDFETEISEEFKAVFDISKAPEDPSEANKYITGVARFLNMHEAAGKPLSSLRVYIVMHGEAANSLLRDEFYREKYNTPNPNIGLLKALNENNVQIVLCGQTAMSRNITKDRRIPEAKLALSAMTALVQLQNRQYRLISF